MRLSTSTEWLFFHLWKKNNDTGKSCPGVFIADTVIYRWAQPYFWYFTTKNGQIVRKTKDKIFGEHIHDVFNSNVSQSEVTAYYMTQEQQEKQQNDKIDFEYFNKKTFHHFLLQREKSLTGILQKFVEPKNLKNHMIKVSWTPQFCLLQRKTNIHSIIDSKVSQVDRLATFDGREYLSESDSISSPILSNDLEQTCLNIVKHVQEISGGNIQISKMVLYFKLDDKNRLWLMFCSGIKIREKFQIKPQINSKQKIDRIPSPIFAIQDNDNILRKILKNEVDINKRPKNLKENVFQYIDPACAYCLKETQLYDIKFKHLIQTYEHHIASNSSYNPMNIKDEENKNQYNFLIRLEEQGLPYAIDYIQDKDEKNNNNEIPGVIQNVWGKMNEQKFQILKQNPSWLNLSAKVCDECYTKFTEITYENDEVRNVKQQRDNIQSKTKAIQKQDPQEIESLREYHEAEYDNIKQKKSKSKQNNLPNLQEDQTTQQCYDLNSDYIINEQKQEISPAPTKKKLVLRKLNAQVSQPEFRLNTLNTDKNNQNIKFLHNPANIYKSKKNIPSTQKLPKLQIQNSYTYSDQDTASTQTSQKKWNYMIDTINILRDNFKELEDLK